MSVRIDKQYLESLGASYSYESTEPTIEGKCWQLVSLLISVAMRGERTLTLSGNDALFITENLDYVTNYLENRNLSIDWTVVDPLANAKVNIPKVKSTFYHIGF